MLVRSDCLKQANYNWQLPQAAELPTEFTDQLKKEDVPDFLGQLLWQRGVKTKQAVEAFFIQH